MHCHVIYHSFHVVLCKSIKFELQVYNGILKTPFRFVEVIPEAKKKCPNNQNACLYDSNERIERMQVKRQQKEINETVFLEREKER